MKPSRRHHARGVGLIDALIALAILAFGLLAMTRFQGRMVAQTTEVQSRSVAIGLADELMSTALVDPANLACYTVPAAGSCGNAVARTNTDEWAERVAARLPGTASATATVAGTRLTVVLNWTGKASDDPPQTTERELRLETDVQ